MLLAILIPKPRTESYAKVTLSSPALGGCTAPVMLYSDLLRRSWLKNDLKSSVMTKTAVPRMSAASCITFIAMATARVVGFTSFGHTTLSIDSFSGITRTPSASKRSLRGAPASFVHLGLSGSKGRQTEPQAAEKKGTIGISSNTTVHPLATKRSASSRYFDCTGRKDLR